MTRSHVEWACASRPYPGLPVTGDRAVVVEHAAGVLLAAIDGLGHGLEAEVASRAAAEVLKAHPDRSVEELVSLCHRALAGTRGAALTLASVDPWAGALRWTGVGNVSALLRPQQGERRRVVLRTTPGVVGYRAVRARAETQAVENGDLLVLASDGLHPQFEQAVDPSLAVDRLADTLLARFARNDDDALVVVARMQLDRTPNSNRERQP